MANGWRKGALERNSTHGGPGIGDPDWVVARRGLVGMEGDGGGRRLAVVVFFGGGCLWVLAGRRLTISYCTRVQ